MKRKDPLFYLEDIQNSLFKILKYTERLNFNQFLNNDMLRDAVERNFEIIGEAVKNLPEDFRNNYPHIPFKQIAGMRDKLIYDYFGVDYEIVWKTIQDRLPQFSIEIKQLIETNKNP